VCYPAHPPSAYRAGPGVTESGNSHIQFPQGLRKNHSAVPSALPPFTIKMKVRNVSDCVAEFLKLTLRSEFPSTQTSTLPIKCKQKAGGIGTHQGTGQRRIPSWKMINRQICQSKELCVDKMIFYLGILNDYS